MAQQGQQAINFKTSKPQLQAPSPKPQTPSPKPQASVSQPRCLKRPHAQNEVLTTLEDINKRVKLAAESYLPQNNLEPNALLSNDPAHPITRAPLPPLVSKRPYTGFTPFLSYNVENLTEKLFLTPAPPSTRRTGLLYLFTRPSDPHVVKIGTTHHQTVGIRKAAIKCTCRYEPEYQIVIENVPFASRIEAMIHKELEFRGVRRIEKVCRFGNVGALSNAIAKDSNNAKANQSEQGPDRDNTTVNKATKLPPPPCKGNHQEWFALPVEGPHGARSIMQKWVHFFHIAQPYNLETGILKPEFEQRITALPGDKRLLSCNVLLAIWAEIRSPVEAVRLRYVERQVIWTRAVARKRRMFVENVEKRKWNVDRIVKEEQNGNYGVSRGSRTGGETDPATGCDNAVIGKEDLGCMRSSFSDRPGESVSLGCENLDHGNRVCAFEMWCEFYPTTAL